MNDQTRMSHGEVGSVAEDDEGVPFTAGEGPDYLARQQVLFGHRALPDSQVILDELRAERF